MSRQELTTWLTPVQFSFRVRFSETDLMGVTWHGNYFSWFEMGRLEHLRQHGISFRAFAEAGYGFAVIHAECDYKKPARYDDLVTMNIEITKTTPTRIEHTYHLYRDQELLAVGKTVVVTLDRNGKVMRIPDWIFDQKTDFTALSAQDNERKIVPQAE